MLVLCSKATRETPNLHPRIRRMLEADPQLASAVEDSPHLLWRLEQQSERLVRSGRKPTARGKELPAAAIYVSLIVVANSYSQVAALLHSAISQGAANVMTTSAVFDRLRTLQAGSRRGSVEDLQAAFQVALEHALQLLPDADPRSLTALVRAAYQLGLAVPEEEQHRIVSKFIRLVRARQSPPAPKAGPPPPKPGWVQVKLPQRRPSEPPGIGKLPAHGASGSSKGCGVDGTATAITDSGSGHSSSRGGLQQASKASFGASHDVNHSLSVFVWAILSNPQWQVPDEQLAELMECVHLQPMDLPQDNTNILVGLVRYANTKGTAAVRPYTKEGGAAETVLDRVLLQLAVLERQDCSDTLISIGKLRLRFPPGSLAALFRQALEALEEKAKQLQAVGSRSRMLDISKLFFGLSRVYDLGREECRAALDLPAARDLAQEFAEHAFYPQDYEIWSEMLIACCQMRFNPPVGSQRVPLLARLLRQLPAMRGSFAYLTSLELLLSLGYVYGLPAGGQAAPELRPYQKSLVSMARGCLKLFDRHSSHPLWEEWCAARRHFSGNPLHLLQAYASLE